MKAPRFHRQRRFDCTVQVSRAQDQAFPRVATRRDDENQLENIISQLDNTPHS